MSTVIASLSLIGLLLNSPFAYYDFFTTAENVEIVTESDLADAAPFNNLRAIGVNVDGTLSTYQMDLGTDSVTLNFPDTQERRIIVYSGNTDAQPYGTYIDDILADGPVYEKNKDTERAMLFIGDSIVGGWVTGDPHTDSFLRQVMTASHDPVHTYAYAGMVTFDLGRAELATLISDLQAEYDSLDIIMGVGILDIALTSTNAYAISQIKNFANTYDDDTTTNVYVLALHIFDPFASLQTLVNGFNTQVSDHCALGNCTWINPGILAEDTEDGLHPNLAGHAKYFDAIDQANLIRDRVDGAIGGTVWHDENEDGLLNVGEEGITGVEITLSHDYNQNGIIDAGENIATTLTDVDGNYEFNIVDNQGVYSGENYIVAVTDGSDILATHDHVSSIEIDDQYSKDPTGYVVVLAYDDYTNQTADFGYVEQEVVVEAPPSSSGGASRIRYTCKDEQATNYDRFGRHDASLCVYGKTTVLPLITTTTPTTTQNGLGSPQGGNALCNIINPNFKRGMRGEDVATIQQFLTNELGITIDVDGIFGPQTHNAVVMFQEKYANEILSPWNMASGSGWWYTTTDRQAKSLTGC